MKWKLTRPLVSFDLETTGVNKDEDRIVEISAIKMNPSGVEVVMTKRYNPSIPIPPGAQGVHGISNEDVADLPPFASDAQKWASYFRNCDVLGYNIKRFDIPLLEAEFRRAQVDFNLDDAKIVDALLLWRHFEPHTLSRASEYFLGHVHDGAHGAEADARASIAVAEAQAERWNLPIEVDTLAEICDPHDPDEFDRDGKLKWEGENLVMQFGKYRGRGLGEVAIGDPRYLRWCLTQDFSKIVLTAMNAVLDGRKIKRMSSGNPI